mmetsp:Transcript_6591/g.14225  ORF Transcript_6591/g.14225 Transcript_6591/m.14225 type:complete len:349 (-) Transcript_6591:243-1289(-)|eukprot:CAMPEP_0113316576 /NCGR_PEP_ID=MMETSP0010_2-20120614/11804_1 /TAXON_ID=216773 ORGANISM="Corethron hystrix, Strain 308" /NCGR_SAMPLE_ID=MMETSP0010_2 /ASSEMBLY_ACC=CAM_ASM_000155 /LENGTH=348 /DNA_ID=CAMNT_0000173335 /DNA_START=13 /DNA_END=1059 /DNA_ORIENTATION=+ /assembly_acc=CAM_ASM_000155
MDKREKGIVLLLLATCFVSPDAAFVRFLSEGSVDTWTIIFWKLSVCTLFAFTYALFATGGFAGLFRSAKLGARFYALAIPVQMLTDIGFTTSFFYSPAAEALALIYLNPLWAGLLGAVFLGDVLPQRTAVALIMALLSVSMMFIPEVFFNDHENDMDHSTNSSPTINLRGTFIAFATGVLVASYFTIVRAALTHSPNISMTGAAAGGGLAAAAFSFFIRQGDVFPGEEWTSIRPLWQFYAAVLADGAGVGCLFVACSVVPEFVTGAEIGLIMLIELVLGPFWVYLVFGDCPSVWTLRGGSLLLMTLIAHEIAPLCQNNIAQEYSNLGDLEEMPSGKNEHKKVVDGFQD